ncbi:macro domain-containing protein [Brevundimonas sp.]|jgi:O-acetyl-ADP-ribose deacetylase (regulator of RNase III)|uniref:type II toxin-antitoxin system antitoxin DNA ADP-ribosyl glycohydrolase DarG n=1 Tax=Brevundimonas sp. TaxID=1871086 RepID=UPI0028A7A9F6|nr:macro domain-containing protein [Brevundimonas sp.]
MIRYTSGNLFESGAEALVNTVNTVGVMGKGIALMFKEAFPENFKAYDLACKRDEVVVGKVFVTRRSDMLGPQWIINFPTKKHWRYPSKVEWIEEGLNDLKRFIVENGVRSIALPPLGAGNGGLDWTLVRPRIEAALGDLQDVEIIVYEPIAKYQNVAKRAGVEKLTPARALIAEIVRRYWVLGIECTLLEVQKLAWFLENTATDLGLEDPLQLKFEANRFGPYADQLRHLLNNLDGSYLHCDKRISDAGPLDVIWFDDAKKTRLEAYLTTTEASVYKPVLEATSKIIDGFESPLGMELLATVDWLRREGVETSVHAMRASIKAWPGGEGAAVRKAKIFDDRLVALALNRLAPEIVAA